MRGFFALPHGFALANDVTVDIETTQKVVVTPKSTSEFDVDIDGATKTLHMNDFLVLYGTKTYAEGYPIITIKGSNQYPNVVAKVKMGTSSDGFNIKNHVSPISLQEGAKVQLSCESG